VLNHVIDEKDINWKQHFLPKLENGRATRSLSY
jgi:hypothetical protein